MREFKTTQQWDDKFGIIDKPKCSFQTKEGECGWFMPDTMRDCEHKGEETKCANYYPDGLEFRKKAVIDGVGADAEVVTNSRGGKQSKSPMTMHLVDPEYLKDVFEDIKMEYESPYCMSEEEFRNYNLAKAGAMLADGMLDPVNIINCIDRAMYQIQPESLKQVTEIAKVLQYGAERYAVNNWRLIPQEEHINHALIHLVAAMMGDTQDDHINHCLTRLMMARATEQSKGFSYTEYIGK